MLRSILPVGAVLSLALLASGAHADKKKKEKPLKSAAGGAAKLWACKQLSEVGCDLAKRCEPDRANRYCRKVRERCDEVKDGNAAHATEDDVTSCRDALSDLECRQVDFDTLNGVNIDFKKFDLCSGVSQDNLLPPVKDVDITPKAEKPKTDDKPKADDGADDASQPSKGKPSSDD